VPPVERFLERAVSNREHKSRDSSRGSSPVRSPMSLQSNFSRDGDNSSHGFRVKLRHEKQSKFSSIVQKLRGIDQSAWRQHVMGGKLRETNDEARTFAIGNKSLASLFVHTPAGKIFVHCPGSYHVLKLVPDLYLCHTAKNSISALAVW
jgi:hypothetical protein